MIAHTPIQSFFPGTLSISTAPTPAPPPRRHLATTQPPLSSSALSSFALQFSHRNRSLRLLFSSSAITTAAGDRYPTPTPPATTKLATGDMSVNDVVGSGQNVIVMRHGDRKDNFEPEWVKTAERPWDPPLVPAGRARAYRTGQKLRDQLGCPIHRVFVSPFLRCVETASEVVAALCATGEGGRGSEIDPSKVQVSIEYGLCEMLNREAVRLDVAPKDGHFHFNISELGAMLPSGTVDHSVERIYPEMPRWEEDVSDSRRRYAHIIQALADKFPSENLLLVTHGEGVGTSVSTFAKDAVVYEVEYCAYSHLRRLTNSDVNRAFTAGNFQLLTPPQVTGISYYTSSSLADGV